MKPQSFKFNLKNTKDPETEELVYIITMYKRNRVKVSTGKKVLVKCWDSKEQQCIISNQFSENINRHNKRINKFLKHLKEGLQKEFLLANNYLYHEGYHGTKESIKRSILNKIKRLTHGEIQEKEKKKIKPLEFFQTYVDGMDKRIIKATGTFISPRTIIHHKTVLKRFIDFFYHKNLQDDFAIFNDRFAIQFEEWAYKSKNYRSNTIPASFSILKVWLNEAHKEGLIENIVYKSFKSKPSNVDNIYLTKDEIERLYQLNIPELKDKGLIDKKSACEITRDLFIVGCWTGLRLSDLKNINEANLNLENNTITVIALKTKQKVVIPLHSFVKEIYFKYDKKFPRSIDKSKSIIHLQHLGMLAEINTPTIIKDNKGGVITTTTYPKYQLIMNHTARRSFATNLYLSGAPSISIMQLTGHTTETNFLKYIKVTKEENAEFMRSFFQ